ncbi:MAG: antibiotic biosynthesis monooxygenase [Sphingopyxis sp.]|nr:antibiotic biosynthesis monooxygenase [Sphingopyxis sp.]
MTILRHYVMTAAEGRGSELREALVDLATRVAPLAGSERIELFADPRDPDSFIFIEHWSSIDCHKAAGTQLGKDAFAAVMAILARAPDGRYLQAMPLTT